MSDQNDGVGRFSDMLEKVRGAKPAVVGHDRDPDDLDEAHDELAEAKNALDLAMMQADHPDDDPTEKVEETRRHLKRALLHLSNVPDEELTEPPTERKGES